MALQPLSGDLTATGTAGSVPLVQWSADSRSVTITDGDLARAIASAPPGGAQAEESELYRRFAPRVRLYGLKHLRHESDAQDLAQQVLLVVIERLRAGDVRTPEQIGSFILGTSRLLAGASERKTRRRDTLVARFHEANLYAKPTLDSDLAAVERCLHQLADRDRRVLLLTFYAEKNASEIAGELGVTGTVVRVTRHRALARMRACIGLHEARTA